MNYQSTRSKMNALRREFLETHFSVDYPTHHSSIWDNLVDMEEDVFPQMLSRNILGVDPFLDWMQPGSRVGEGKQKQARSEVRVNVHTPEMVRKSARSTHGREGWRVGVGGRRNSGEREDSGLGKDIGERNNYRGQKAMKESGERKECGKRNESGERREKLEDNSKESLEGVFKKIRELKEEFQNVEEKLRSACQSLPKKGEQTPGNRDWESLSDRSFRNRNHDEYDTRSCRSWDGEDRSYIPGQVAEKIRMKTDLYKSADEEKDCSRPSSPTKSTRSSVSSPVYPFLSDSASQSIASYTGSFVPPRGYTTHKDLPFPSYNSQTSEYSEPFSCQTSEYSEPSQYSQGSGVSSPTYPFGNSPTSSSRSASSPTPSESTSPSSISGSSTIRGEASRPYSPLTRSDTFIQIPIIHYSEVSKGPSVTSGGHRWIIRGTVTDRYQISGWSVEWHFSTTKRDSNGRVTEEKSKDRIIYKAQITEYQNYV